MGLTGRKHVFGCILALNNPQIGTLWSKNCQISLQISKLALFGPPNGNYKFFSQWCWNLYHFLKKISILLQNVVFWTPFNMLLRCQSIYNQKCTLESWDLIWLLLISNVFGAWPVPCITNNLGSTYLSKLIFNFLCSS